MSKETLVPVREVDYLDQDPPLRGQNYVCLSFVSPEDVIKKKDVYFFEEFLKGFSADMSEWFANMSAKFPGEADTLKGIKERYSYVFDQSKMSDEYHFFVNTNNARLDDDYHKLNDFQTSIRGLKVRGVFDTIREAEVRAQVLKKLDDKFNVYVAQVGCWCPWSPNPDDISDQEYAETHLNTMMKKYKENQDKRDIFYMERKREMQFSTTAKKLESEDPWMSNKQDEGTSASVSEPVDNVVVTSESIDTSNTNETDVTVVPASDPVVQEEPEAPSTPDAIDAVASTTNEPSNETSSV